MNRQQVTPELNQLARNYSRAFPTHPKLAVDKGWLYGAWIVGHRQKQHYYGQYPGGFLKRLQAMFPNAKTVLHAFSGMVEKGTFSNAHEYTIDINPHLSPDIIAKVEDFTSPLRFDLILADPPYTKDDAAKYGFPPPNKKKCVENLAKHLQPSGSLCWLDTFLPPKIPLLLFVGTIAIMQSRNHRVRMLSIFKRSTDEVSI